MKKLMAIVLVAGLIIGTVALGVKPTKAEARTSGTCPALVVAADAQGYPSLAGWYRVIRKSSGIITATVTISTGSGKSCRVTMNKAFYLIMYANCRVGKRCAIWTD